MASAHVFGGTTRKTRKTIFLKSERTMIQIGIRARLPHAKALSREGKTKNKMKTINTISTMASALVFGGTTRKTRKTIFFEIRTDYGYEGIKRQIK